MRQMLGTNCFTLSPESLTQRHAANVSRTDLTISSSTERLRPRSKGEVEVLRYMGHVRCRELGKLAVHEEFPCLVARDRISAALFARGAERA